MSICCKAIRQIYYNAGSGYTVVSYMTNEDLPEEVKKQKNGNYGIFQAFGTELPTNEGLDVELTGDWKPTKYGMQCEQFFSNHANHKRRYSDLFVVIPDQRDRTGNGSPHRRNVWGRHTECF